MFWFTYWIKHAEATAIDIHTLAKKCYCSPATIVRICKKNGFRALKNWKLAPPEWPWFFQRAGTGKIFKAAAVKICRQSFYQRAEWNIHAIQNTFSPFDFQELNTIVDLLSACRYVYLFGIGRQLLGSRDLQQSLSVLKKTILYEDIHLQLSSIDQHRTGVEVAIIFSYSGLTEGNYRNGPQHQAARRHYHRVTKYGSSKPISLKDYNLYVPQDWSAAEKSVPGSSRISQLSVVDKFYQAYLASVHSQSMDKIIATNKLLEKRKRNSTGLRQCFTSLRGLKF